MSNPTQQEVTDAHNALNKLFTLVKHPPITRYDLNDADKLREIVRKALPSRPVPTMAEVEWDDDKHRLAEAEDATQGKVIMMRKLNELIIEVINPRNRTKAHSIAFCEDLTPTGRRLTFVDTKKQ